MADQTTRADWNVPPLEAFDDLLQIVQDIVLRRSERLYVRYSQGPEVDGRSDLDRPAWQSRNQQNGKPEAGLSCLEIRREHAGDRERLRCRLYELRQKYKKLFFPHQQYPWLLQGRELDDRCGDGEPLLADIIPVARISNDAER